MKNKIINNEKLLFLISSILSFIIDYIVYSLCIFLSNNIIFSNIFSRSLSSSINYNLNKKIVFKSNKCSIVKYYFLVFSILIFNTILLFILTNILMLNKFFSKIIVEIILFILSWVIQKNIIFKKEMVVNDES